MTAKVIIQAGDCPVEVTWTARDDRERTLTTTARTVAPWTHLSVDIGQGGMIQAFEHPEGCSCGAAE